MAVPNENNPEYGANHRTSQTEIDRLPFPYIKMKYLFQKPWIINLLVLGYCHAACFENREELADAVIEYLQDNSSTTTVAKTYGWPIGSWCVSNVTDFSKLFFNATSFNDDLSKWETSQVLSMNSMFEMATSFNQPLSAWNVSRTRDFDFMFLGASSFNQDLSFWDTSSSWTMKNMFSGAKRFNGDVSLWNVENCLDMSGMFQNADAFNQDISEWNVSQATDIRMMFHGAKSFDQNLCSWGSKIQMTVVSDMFDGTSCPTTDDPDWSSPIKGPLCFECQQEDDHTDDYANVVSFLPVKMLLLLVIPVLVVIAMKFLKRNENAIDPSDSKLTEFELLHLAEEG
eukprot:scaffold1184_cov132-Cylindrotheca_fusiformis.AAC.81